MISRYTIIFCGFVLFFTYFARGQVSLWQDRNIYGNNLQAGQLIEVKVDENFVININSKWDTSKKIDLQLLPDTKNFNFLFPSQQNKNSNRNTNVQFQIRDSYHFSIQAVVGQPGAGTSLYSLQARKDIVVDRKPASILLSGLIHPKYVKNDQVSSKHIANLRLNVIAEPPPERDTSIALKPPEPEEIEDPENPPPSKAELSEQEKQDILLRHLQEIIEALR